MNGLSVVILLKILGWRDGAWSLREISRSIGVSYSQVHSSYQMLTKVGLIGRRTQSPAPEVMKEFFVYASKYLFPPTFIGDDIVGMPTAYSSYPLAEKIISSSAPIVWEHSEGEVLGKGLKPIHAKIPDICLQDRQIYSFIVCLDALRIGRSREVVIAKEWIVKTIDEQGARFV